MLTPGLKPLTSFRLQAEARYGLQAEARYGLQAGLGSRSGRPCAMAASLHLPLPAPLCASIAHLRSLTDYTGSIGILPVRTNRQAVRAAARRTKNQVTLSGDFTQKKG